MPAQPAPPSLDPAPGRFLHLVADEKYIDAIRGVLEDAAPGAHDYLVVGPVAPLRYLRTFTPVQAELQQVLARDFLSRLPRYCAVFVHYLTDPARLIVARAPRATRFFWLAWGADYYHLLHGREELLLPRTRSLASTMAVPVQPRRVEATLQTIAGLARAALRPLPALRRFRLRALARRVGPGGPAEAALINRFHGAGIPEEELGAIRAAHPRIRVPFLDWSYWPEGFFADQAPLAPVGRNILLGNSATETNNHLDALDLLRAVLPPERKVICPLSYGDARYADAIERAGHELLGDRFVPLRHFMESGAYAQVLASCSILVMNHVRQQGMGNIIVALCSGAHVFLNERNPIHGILGRLDVRVHTLRELPEFLAGGEPPMSGQQVREVRMRIERQYGRASILRRTRALLEGLRQSAPGRAVAGTAALPPSARKRSA